MADDRKRTGMFARTTVALLLLSSARAWAAAPAIAEVPSVAKTPEVAAVNSVQLLPPADAGTVVLPPRPDLPPLETLPSVNAPNPLNGERVTPRESLGSLPG